MSKESTYTVVTYRWGPRTHTHAHTNAQKEMELEVFIAPSARREDGLREEQLAWTCPPRVVLHDLGVTGLELATRGRSKHQVRRVASGVGTLLQLTGR